MNQLDERFRNIFLKQISDPNSVNQESLLPGANPFGTELDPESEKEFSQFANQIKQIPTMDFDLRGAFQEAKQKGLVKDLLGGKETELGGINPTTQSFHFTDKYKTPFHSSFSKESKFAQTDAPGWVPNGDGSFSLVDKMGKTLIDERREAIREQNPDPISGIEELLSGIKIRNIKRNAN